MQKACIVIPCFNESSRLSLETFDIFLQKEKAIDFLFVNDGSTDDTLILLKKYQSTHPERVFLLDMPQNSGKAEAVRCGILEACNKSDYEYVGFWDADLATPLSEITNFLKQMDNKVIAMGSRIKRLGAIVERKESRHFLGRIFATFASLILKIPVYDTQCGAKLFRSDLSVLFEEKFITKWMFDVELLARYRNKFGRKSTLSNIIEVPVNSWIEMGGSKLKFRHMVRTPFELVAIYLKYN